MTAYTRTLPRYEIKLPLQGVDKAVVLSWVRLHPAHWYERYPPRQVNNIYFDSYNVRALRANLHGVAERSKLRLRWYGPAIHKISTPSLELKCRQGNVGWKEIVNLDGNYAPDNSGTWTEFNNTLFADLIPQAKRWMMDYPRAALVSHYQRLYYETFDGKVRLTLDSDLRSYPQGSSVHPNLSRPVPVDPTNVVVLELKTAPEHASRLSEIIADLPVTAQRFSKYVQGLAAGWGLKSEEFV